MSEPLHVIATRCPHCDGGLRFQTPDGEWKDCFICKATGWIVTSEPAPPPGAAWLDAAEVLTTIDDLRNVWGIGAGDDRVALQVCNTLALLRDAFGALAKGGATSDEAASLAHGVPEPGDATL